MLGLMILAVAIAAEIAGTLAMGLSRGFVVRPLLALSITVPGYGIAIAGMTLLMRWRLMNLSVAYAIWVGLGVALVAVLSSALGHEPMSPLKIFFLVLIVVGAVGLDLVG